MQPKILIVEDAEALLEAYCAKLRGAFAVTCATTLMKAIEAVEADKAFDAVVVDGCFPYEDGDPAEPEPGRVCNGEKFVLWLRGGEVGYRGPIVACSAHAPFNERMIACGATRDAVKGQGVCDALAVIFPSAKPAD